MIGFKIDELMTGTHRFTDKPGTERPMLFSLTWGSDSLLKFLNPFSRNFLLSQATGFITVDGLVDKAECSGTLHLRYFSGRKIVYELFFQDEKGVNYRYVGEKLNLWPWNLYRTHFTCYGTITDLSNGKVISESVVYFPYREIFPFACSFRLRLGRVLKYS